IAGAGVTGSYSFERDLRMAPGDQVELAGWAFRFEGIREVRGPNYHSQMGTLTVTRNGRQVTQLQPEKRRYQGGQVMTEVGLHGRLARDLYVALGEPLDGGTWSLRIHVKPGVRWIWLGGALIALGAALAAADRRYRIRAIARKGATAA